MLPGPRRTASHPPPQPRMPTPRMRRLVGCPRIVPRERPWGSSSRKGSSIVRSRLRSRLGRERCESGLGRCVLVLCGKVSRISKRRLGDPARVFCIGDEIPSGCNLQCLRPTYLNNPSRPPSPASPVQQSLSRTSLDPQPANATWTPSASQLFPLL